MFNLIIVDDEKTIRDGLSRLIDRSNLGFRVSKLFANASDAIEEIKLGDVDLVITDIKMLSVSGLDLARFVYENYSYIPVIIISGYADFDYAIEAMKYNVKDYLTKPTNLAQVREILSKMYHKLNEEKESRKQQDTKVLSQTFSVFRYCKMLLQSIISIDFESVTDMVHSIMSVLPDEPKLLSQYMMDLYEIVWQGLEEMGVSMDRENALEMVISQAELFQTKEEHKDHLIFNITAIVQYNQLLKTGIENFSIYRAEKFIKRNFRKNISLEDVAEYCGLSPTYFSRFFHKVVGKTFVEYITEVRIEEAKKLLRKKEYKVYEISGLVGFQSSNYFNTLFKKHTGITPLEFSELNLEESSYGN